MARGNQKIKSQERNAKKAQEKTSTTAEDRKKMAAANSAVQCTICMQGFMKSVRRPELETHLEGKHAKAGKTFAEAFPSYVE